MLNSSNDDRCPIVKYEVCSDKTSLVCVPSLFTEARLSDVFGPMKVPFDIVQNITFYLRATTLGAIFKSTTYVVNIYDCT